MGVRVGESGRRSVQDRTVSAVLESLDKTTAAKIKAKYV